MATKYIIKVLNKDDSLFGYVLTIPDKKTGYTAYCGDATLAKLFNSKESAQKAIESIFGGITSLTPYIVEQSQEI